MPSPWSDGVRLSDGNGAQCHCRPLGAARFDLPCFMARILRSMRGLLWDAGCRFESGVPKSSHSTADQTRQCVQADEMWRVVNLSRAPRSLYRETQILCRRAVVGGKVKRAGRAAAIR